LKSLFISLSRDFFFKKVPRLGEKSIPIDHGEHREAQVGLQEIRIPDKLFIEPAPETLRIFFHYAERSD
ncbi:MAG: hypothetical protein KDC92_17530, partial [Bacteroidetes bacterium]|nr:hypothetical protein [Bacteroidota bacterium]